MNARPTPVPTMAAVPQESLDLAVARSGQAWHRLFQHVRSITPAQLGRILLVLAALAVSVWLLVGAWDDLLPFKLGFVLAYITLPIVDALDNLMPRWLAACVVVVLELLAILLLVALLVPPLVQQLPLLVQALPSLSEVDERIDQFRASLATLPEPTQQFLLSGVNQLTYDIRTHLFDSLQLGLGALTAGVFGLFNTVGFLLGFVGIPTWLVAVLSDHKAGKRALNRLLPAWVQPDLWAVVRIVDRVFSVYVRGQFVMGVIVGCLAYGGLLMLERLGITETRYELILALIAGVAQLIPVLGPILGAIPAVLLTLAVSPQASIAVLALYVGIQFLVHALVAPWIEGRYVDIHPAVFVIVLVIVSQFGFIWVVLAAPLSIVVRDLFRYVYGRLAEPPRPAGLLPGEVPVQPALTRSMRGVRKEVVVDG
jgi:predicted PurR-regulated permease PerM